MKVLFILHDASKTGAPHVLYNFLRKNDGIHEFAFEVLFLSGGPLIPLFKKFTKVHFFEESNDFVSKVKRKVFNSSISKSIDTFLNKNLFDLYYINSTTSLSKLKSLDFLRSAKSILHAHELNVNILSYKTNIVLKEHMNDFDTIVCVSKLVEKNLIVNYSLDVAKSKIVRPLSLDMNDQTVKSLDFSENTFVVGGCGHIEMTKGLDLFIQVAAKVVKCESELRPIYFCWLGNLGNKNILEHIRSDIKKLNLENKIRILESTDNPNAIFRNFNLFFLSSREDSFPLVAIENAKLGNPVVCFDKGNGIVEFVDNENGAVVPYLDIDQAAKEILKLYDNADLLELKSNKIKEDSKILNNEEIYKKMLTVINEC